LWIHTCGSIMAPQATVDLTYSATDLLQLNSSSRRLPTEVYKLCTSLCIARRPRFLHRGGRRKIHFHAASDSTIPTVLSAPLTRSSIRQRRSGGIDPRKPTGPGGGANGDNLRYLEFVRCTQSSISMAAKVALLNTRSVSNKTFLLNDFFTQRCLDLLFLTETWLGAGETSFFGELCPTNCSFLSTPISSGRGGGVALVFRDTFKLRLLSVGSYSTFEIQCVMVESTSTPLVCALVYRPFSWLYATY
jgi:hypothetical protein